MKNLLISSCLASIIVFGFTSCGKDDGAGCSSAWASEVADEVDALTDASQAYALDPTTAKCNAYKDAAQDYVDALESFRGCSGLTGASRTDWENAVNSAQASVNAISC